MDKIKFERVTIYIKLRELEKALNLRPGQLDWWDLARDVRSSYPNPLSGIGFVIPHYNHLMMCLKQSFPDYALYRVFDTDVNCDTEELTITLVSR